MFVVQQQQVPLSLSRSSRHISQSLSIHPSHPSAMQHPSQPPNIHPTAMQHPSQPPFSHATSNHQPASCSGRRTDARLKMNTNQRGIRVYTPRTCVDVAPWSLKDPVIVYEIMEASDFF
ncbi:hypothetical protein Pcinc_040898 [Petrolisthes cinctipes]|uniref:Uncharacterized protein n=1 Tax=Petrolisthes cinctipes TaxID=88211 RepID=A0AAE1BPE8_PETCI|nr:hypothetical protein Pcinc_040898 [Petrolisthes cinctipes]